MARKTRRPRPAGNGGDPLEFIAAASGDGSNHSLDLPVSQLLPRDVRPDELRELRAMFWRQASTGFRLPAEIDVIVIEGGAS